MNAEPDYDYLVNPKSKFRLVIPKADNQRLDAHCAQHVRDLVRVTFYQIENNPDDEMHEVDNDSDWLVFVTKVPK
jgi:hypothetical protein